MWRLVKGIAFTLLASLCLTGVGFAKDEALRLLTWNLQWFPGGQPASTKVEKLVHLSRAREALAELSPDIICLQEIQSADAVNKLLPALPGFSLQVLSNFNGTQQIAILSKLAASTAFAQEFEPSANTPPRGFVYAEYRSGNRHLLVYSVHLKSNYGGIEANIAKREESARQLVAHTEHMKTALAAQGAKEIIIVIAGDFNTDPGDKRFAPENTSKILIESGLGWTWDTVPFENRITWAADGRYPDACFDHVFSSARGIIASVDSRYDSVSDHRPVLARFPFKLTSGAESSQESSTVPGS